MGGAAILTDTVLRRADDLLSGPLPTVLSHHPATPWPGRRRWRVPAPHVWGLLAITLLGGFLRFDLFLASHRLEWPALWNDDTLVFWRVCGTYGQMLVPLHDHDLFPPLHYSLYWLLGHPVPVGPSASRAILGWVATFALSGLAGLIAAVALQGERRWVRRSVPVAVAVFCWSLLAVVAVLAGPGWLIHHRLVPAERTLKLTPWVMRAVPAICGTLNIPAMYFLARQLFPRRTALVAALVTACSAFMLFYSRDGKMYADGWLLVTVNVGCLLWWFRTGLSTVWLAWIAAGCGMVGLNGNTAVVPALSVVFLLTQRRLRWQTTVLFLVGLMVTYAGLAGYYGKFSTAADRVEAGGWGETGLGWVGGFYNGDRTGPDLVGYTATAYLSGYEWPRDDYPRLIEQSLQDVPQTVALLVVGILAVAALPWPLVRAIVRPDRQAMLDAAAPEPAWRVWLWVGAWIIVPAYGYYCHSINDFVTPRRWLWEAGDAVTPVEWAVMLAGLETLVAAAFFRRSLWSMVGRLIGFWVATAVIFGLCMGVAAGWAYPKAMAAWFSGRPWGVQTSIWEPRYLGIIWPAVGLGVAALLMRLPTRPVRVAAVLAFCLLNLFMFAMRMRLQSEPPIDRLAADVWAGQKPDTRVYDNITRDGIEVAATSLAVNNPKIEGGRYYLQMLADRPMSPSLFERSLRPDVPRPYVLRERLEPNAVRFDLRNANEVQRVVLWSQLFSDQKLTFDPYRSAMPAGFRLADEQVYPVRVIWDWREKWRWVRREYVRPEPSRK
jgi:4-amino-4-deoxy-L-arabinose transferase-like glycosyltransferase